jgi:hypothetical protein
MKSGCEFVFMLYEAFHSTTTFWKVGRHKETPPVYPIMTMAKASGVRKPRKFSGFAYSGP